MPTAEHTAYDDVPYPSLPSRRTHPSHLAAIARLRGLDPPPVRQCRVLELGCAAGGNLLPMAADLPASSFVGVDFSARQVEAGQRAAAAVGLTNVELWRLNLLEAGDELGVFDYILCHGVYSWVPRPVQEKILAIGRRHLSPAGVMFVSYNTYPGWHMRGVVREMMSYHVRSFGDPATKVAQARALLDFLIRTTPERLKVYRQVLEEEAAILKDRGDSYLYHEHLEDNNEPLYFHQFMERAEAAGLGYVGDTDVTNLHPGQLGPDVAAMLQDVGLLRQEQYLDFIQNRMFRGSLLCHREVTPQPRVDALRLAGCAVGLEDRLELPAVPPAAGEPLVCQTPHDTITIPSPFTQAALWALNERWPDCVEFDRLVEQARGRLGASSGGGDHSRQRRSLAEDLMTLYARRILRAWVDPPSCTAAAGERPLASVLARWQASQGLPATTRRHEGVRLSDLERCLLARLDAEHDRAALGGVLAAAVGRGEFEIRRNDVPVKDPDDATLQQIVEHTLRALGQQALLVS